MSLLKPVETTEAGEAVRASFENLERHIGGVPVMIRLMAHSPAILDTYLHFNHALERTTLTPRVRALITVAVASMHGCDYMLSLGMALAKRQGVEESDLEAAILGHGHDGRTNDILQFAMEIVRQQGDVPEAEVERLLQLGFREQEIVAIIAAVALNIFRNYFNLVVRTDVDSPIASSSPA
jgi:AhpD family alkylhydroperoxidase